MKSKLWPIVIGVGVLGVVVFIVYALTRPDAQPEQPKTAETKSINSDIVSEKGLHWHPKLTIYINGEKQTIPTDIGVSASGHKSPHTHDDTGELHWENEGKVTKNDLKLGMLFDNWGKKFSSTQLFDKTDPSGSKITMTVNGQPNTEFGNHLVADKEQIEIKYQD